MATKGLEIYDKYDGTGDLLSGGSRTARCLSFILPLSNAWSVQI